MKSNQKLTLLFWNRKSKPNSDGSTPIAELVSTGVIKNLPQVGKSSQMNGRRKQKEPKDITTVKGPTKSLIRLQQIWSDISRYYN